MFRSRRYLASRRIAPKTHRHRSYRSFSLDLAVRLASRPVAERHSQAEAVSPFLNTLGETLGGFLGFRVIALD
jgi:hypothetical protein